MSMKCALVRYAGVAMATVSATAMIACSGCGPQTLSGPAAVTSTAVKSPGTEAIDDKEILRQIDDALDFTYEKRRLNVREQAAWQIIHGALAFKRQFQVRDGERDVSAVDYVLQGGEMKGWNLLRGDLLDEKTQRYGVKALLEQGTKTGQGHSDQWLGYLSDCELSLDEPIVVEGKKHTIADWVVQIERDVHKEPIREYSWTLMVLTAYHPTDYEWTAADGSKWSIAKLVEIELEHDLADSPCGGTHRMVSLTMARNRHVARGGELTGVWQQCDEKIEACIAKARELQNPDGSLSSNYLQRPGNAADLALVMGSAGHVMEFLAVSMDKEELEQEWVRRAVLKVCETFRKTKPIDVECGALFHAAHGLVLYREKVYGPRSFPRNAVTTTAATGG